MSKNGLIYEGIVNGFNCAKWLMKQRPHIKGLEHLKNLPAQVIFTITHDSYFEIPSLASVYKAIEPAPTFTIMAKEDFLSGRYLSLNFFQDSAFLSSLLKLIDKTGAPKAIFNKLNLISIPRPFADAQLNKHGNFKHQISSQFSQFKSRISDGFSTVIFPEGTTWGYGGLRKIRSAVYQLVSTSFDQHGKKIYMLPINVKVDKLVKGWKDVFINVGKPEFFIKSKDEFNQQLYDVLQRLHTITFSQIAAYNLKKQASIAASRSKSAVQLKRDQLKDQLEKAVLAIHKRVKEGILPHMDQGLKESGYLHYKLDRFIQYCEKNKYLERLTDGQGHLLDVKKLLSNYPPRQFRKKNPVAFHANELSSLGDNKIIPAFENQ